MEKLYAVYAKYGQHAKNVWNSGAVETNVPLELVNSAGCVRG